MELKSVIVGQSATTSPTTTNSLCTPELSLDRLVLWGGAGGTNIGAWPTSKKNEPMRRHVRKDS